MAITYLYPDGDGNYTQFAAGGGCSPEWRCVSKTVVNDTTYLASSTVGDRQSVSLSALSDGGTINSVTISARLASFSNDVETIKIFLRIGGINYDDIAQNVPFDQVYRNYTKTYTTNPATGQAWTQVEINALEAGVLLFSAAGFAVALRFSQLLATVDFTPGLSYRLDGQNFTCGPLSKRWDQQQIARKGTVESVFAAFWQLELTFGDRPVSDAKFFESRWFAGGFHTISVPHPTTGVMTGFTGVAIRDVSYGYTDIERNSWVDSLQVTFGHIYLGATGSV